LASSRVAYAANKKTDEYALFASIIEFVFPSPQSDGCHTSGTFLHAFK